ncbi:MAG: DUF2779 domain-containing protein [Pseudomonadota bacterium]
MQLLLSKSNYLLGCQCPLRLWLHKHRKDLLPEEIPLSLQHTFDQGHEVGKLAQKYFKAGIEITEDYKNIPGAIDSTKKNIAGGSAIIFEATASTTEGLFCRIDILRKAADGQGWDMIEVKQSTHVAKYHLDDVAFQRYVFENAGYKINKSILMHINNKFIKNGEIDLSEFFVLEDVTEAAIKGQAKVKRNVQKFLKILSQSEEFEIPVGSHCNNPFDCDFIDYCWSSIPKYSVYNIFKRNKNKLKKLLDQNIIKVGDIPLDLDLSSKQRIDIESYQNGEIYKDKAKIDDFLKLLKYPLYFLDYETIFPAIPLFDGTKPYGQVPFQFSLHIQKKKGGTLEHLEYLHNEFSDPRAGLVKMLVSSCCKNGKCAGTVIVYNKPFEATINKSLAAAFPEYKKELLEINQKMKDLLIPFKQRFLYHPNQEGSASIKKVLPAFIPNMNYHDLEIGEGGIASLKYLEMISDSTELEIKEKIYKALKVYCGQDTLAMVKLLEELENICALP